MIIFPAIDLLGGCAVRLFKGDYDKVTVYDKNPANIAKKFQAAGATHIHIVDLDGAKTGDTPNIEVIKEIVSATNMFAEVGGGIRSLEVIKKYLDAGVSRVILGTAAVTQPGFAQEAVKSYGEHIAVGVDIKDGMVAIKGWVEKSDLPYEQFCIDMQKLGVKTIICTDISKDGAMKGTNLELYSSLSKKLDLNIVASGGVSSIEDVKELTKMDIYGAIIGKAYYTGAIDLAQAIKEAEGVK